MDYKKFDAEYRTQWIPEVKYLRDNGIKFNYVKEIDGVTTYKYKKTKELFVLLSKFYR